MEANLRRQSQLARSDASGQLARQMVRLSLTALIYALYCLFSALIWPRSLQTTVERVLEARRLRQAVDDELDSESGPSETPA